MNFPTTIAQAMQPHPEPPGESREIEITREITFKVRVWFEKEQDDDGCDPPSISGNSMTGPRGIWRNVPTAVRIDDKSLIEAACEVVTKDCDDVCDKILNF